MRISLISLLVLSLLPACTPLTREEQLSLFHSRCVDYGYAQGTQEFEKCLERQEARHHQRSIRARANTTDNLNFLEKETLRQQELKLKAIGERLSRTS
jgi:hypothetical protein